MVQRLVHRFKGYLGTGCCFDCAYCLTLIRPCSSMSGFSSNSKDSLGGLAHGLPSPQAPSLQAPSPEGSRCSGKDLVKLLNRVLHSKDAQREAMNKLLVKQLGLVTFEACADQRKSIDPTVLPCRGLHPKASDGMPNEQLVRFIMLYAKSLTRKLKDSSHTKEDVEGFKKIVTSLKLKTSVPFNLLIAHCAILGHIDLCVDLIKTMKEGNVELSAATFEPLITFYSKKLEISKAEHILTVMETSGMLATTKAYEHLVRAYTVSDNFEKAYNLIEYIADQGIVRTTAMYSPIIHAYALKGQYQRAWEGFRALKKATIRPSADNYATFIMACAYRKDFKQAKLVLNAFEKQNDYSTEDVQKVLAAMIKVYANSGNGKDALELLSNSKYKGLLATLDVKSAFVNILVQRGKMEDAKEIFSNIRDTGSWPASYCFNTLLNAMGKIGDLDEMLVIFDTYRKSLRWRDQVHQKDKISTACCSIIQSLMHHNELEKIVQFLQRVRRDQIADVENLCLKVFIGDDNQLRLTLDNKFKLLQAMLEKLQVQPTRIALEALLESCAKEGDMQHALGVVQIMKHINLPLNIFTYLILLRTVVSAGDQDQAKQIAMQIKREMCRKGLKDVSVRKIISQMCSSSPCGKELLCVLYSSKA